MSGQGKVTIAAGRVVALTVLLGGPSAPGQVVQWPVSSGGTGHYYEFVRSPGISWTGAHAAAQARTYLGAAGHLATVSSASENAFLYSNFAVPENIWEGWLGGWQDPGAAPSEGWHWVTSEPWSYTNWAPGEPNDAGGVEDYLQMWGPGTIAPAKWNDDADSSHPGNMSGYFAEYDVPAGRTSRTYAILLGSRAPGENHLGMEVEDLVRGDRAVDLIASRLSWVDDDDLHSIKMNWSDTVDVGAIVSEAFADIREKGASAGDTIIFYYAGHGICEYLTVHEGAGGAIHSEHQLAGSEMLGTAELADVRKLVWLDACHSGSFENEINALSQTAFYSSTNADGKSASAPDGVGFWTHALALEIQVATTLYELGFLEQPQDLFGPYLRWGYGEADWQPIMSFASDTDPHLPLDLNVPGPTTLSLLALGGLALIRRTRQ